MLLLEAERLSGFNLNLMRLYGLICSTDDSFDLTNQEISRILDFTEEEASEMITLLCRMGLIRRRRVNGVRILSSPENSRLKTGRSSRAYNIETKTSFPSCSCPLSILQTTKTASLRIIVLRTIIQRSRLYSAKIANSQKHSGNDADQANLIRDPGFSVKKRVRARLSSSDLELLEKKAANPSSDRNEPPTFYVPADVDKIVDYWNNLGLKRCWKKNTKTYQTTVRRLRAVLLGRMFDKEEEYPNLNRSYTVQEVLRSISRLALCLNDPNYEPIEGTSFHTYLKNMSLADFILNPRARRNRSQFLEMLMKHPELSVRSPEEEDNHPAITKRFIKLYREKILGDLKVEIPTASIFQFRKAANKTYEFFKTNKDQLSLHLLASKPADFANVVMDAILASMSGQEEKITPGYLCSDTTFTRRLPSYLKKHHLVDAKGETYFHVG